MSTAIIAASGTSGWRRWVLWTGRIVSVAPVVVVAMSARWKLTSDPWYVREWERIGWNVEALPTIALLQLVAIGLYVIPRTSILGAVLLTGYMGGAVASYVRIGEYTPPLVPFTTAVLAWAGIFLREQRLWSLLPFRSIPLDHPAAVGSNKVPGHTR
jgi:hypothetical protein